VPVVFSIQRVDDGGQGNATAEAQLDADGVDGRAVSGAAAGSQRQSQQDRYGTELSRLDRAIAH